MTTNNKKLFLFAVLAIALVASISASDFADAAKDKDKQKERENRKVPEPSTDRENHTQKKNHLKTQKDIPGPEYPKRSESSLANEGISVRAGSGHEASGTDIDVSPTNLSGVSVFPEVTQGSTDGGGSGGTLL